MIVTENGSKPAPPVALTGLSPLRPLTGPLCELQKKQDGPRKTLVSAKLVGPRSLGDLKPRVRGAHLEAEPDCEDRELTFKQGAMPRMERHDSDPMPTLMLQHLPAELLPRMVFMRRHEMAEDFSGED